jgi:hypothetical protein
VLGGRTVLLEVDRVIWGLRVIYHIVAMHLSIPFKHAETKYVLGFDIQAVPVFNKPLDGWVDVWGGEGMGILEPNRCGN